MERIEILEITPLLLKGQSRQTGVLYALREEQMKKLITAIAAVILITGTVSVNAEGTIGTAGIVMDFNGDGTTDAKDWDEMRTWVTNYKMEEGDNRYYGGQEVPASINLLIDRDYASDVKYTGEVDVASVSQYYLPTIGSTTGIKDQNPFGTCWAFSTIATLESNLLHKRHGNAGVINPDAFEMNLKNVSKELDLSELYLAYMNMELMWDGSQKGEGDEPLNPEEKNSHFSTGGFSSSSQDLLTAWIGPLAESQEPYKPLDGKDTYGLLNEEDRNAAPLAHVQEFLYLDSPSRYTINTDRQKYEYKGQREDAVNLIKQAVIEHGALMMSYQADTSSPGEGGNSDFMNYEYFCQYDDSSDIGMNHAVTLVGWNDNYPRENFKTGKGGMPKQNGAFLIKNSWGSYETNVEKYGDQFIEVYDNFAKTPEGRDLLLSFNYGFPDEEGHGTGYIWVSYEDHSIFSFSAIVGDDAADGFDYDHIYQYDFTNPVAFDPISLPTDNAETLVANIFTSERDETLAAVSVYAPENNTEAEIEVYRVSDENQDPTSGELLAAATASFDHRGFYTVQLEKPAELKQGDRFAVVQNIVTEKDGEKVSWLNIEQTIREDLQTEDNINAEHVHVVSNPGETLVYVNSGEAHVWADASQLNSTDAGKVMTFGNAYIKAYTVSPDKAPLPDADPTDQGIYEGDASELSTIVFLANLPKYLMWAGIAFVIILILIIFLIVRAVKKRKAKKAAAKATPAE